MKPRYSFIKYSSKHSNLVSYLEVLSSCFFFFFYLMSRKGIFDLPVVFEFISFFNEGQNIFPGIFELAKKQVLFMFRDWLKFYSKAQFH